MVDDMDKIDNELEKFYKELSSNDIKNIKIETEEDFYYNYSNIIYKMHNDIRHYCNVDGLFIYDKVNSSYELIEFIKNVTSLLDKIFINNLKDQMELRDIDGENEEKDY